MSTAQSLAISEEEIHKKNAKLFDQLRAKLQSDTEALYLSAAQTLTTWLDNRKAYYVAARPEILRCLQDARATLKRISGSSAPFTMLSPPNEALGQRRSAYYHLVKVVEKYAELFTEDRHKSVLDQLIASVRLGNNLKPPVPPPTIPKKTPRGKSGPNPAPPTPSSSGTQAPTPSQLARANISPAASRRSSLASEIAATAGRTLPSTNAKSISGKSPLSTNNSPAETSTASENPRQGMRTVQSASTTTAGASTPTTRQRSSRSRATKPPSKTPKNISRPDEQPPPEDASPALRRRTRSPGAHASNSGTATGALDSSSRVDSTAAQRIIPLSAAPSVGASNSAQATSITSGSTVPPVNSASSSPIAKMHDPSPAAQEPEVDDVDYADDTFTADNDDNETPAPEAVPQQASELGIADNAVAPLKRVEITSTQSQDGSMESTKASETIPVEPADVLEVDQDTANTNISDRNQGVSQLNPAMTGPTSSDGSSTQTDVLVVSASGAFTIPQQQTHSVTSPSTTSPSLKDNSKPSDSPSASLHREPSPESPELHRPAVDVVPLAVTYAPGPLPALPAAIITAVPPRKPEGAISPTLAKVGTLAGQSTTASSSAIAGSISTSQSALATAPAQAAKELPVPSLLTPQPSNTAIIAPLELTLSAHGTDLSASSPQLAAVSNLTDRMQVNPPNVSSWATTDLVPILPPQASPTTPVIGQSSRPVSALSTGQTPYHQTQPFTQVAPKTQQPLLARSDIPLPTPQQRVELGHGQTSSRDNGRNVTSVHSWQLPSPSSSISQASATGKTPRVREKKKPKLKSRISNTSTAATPLAPAPGGLFLPWEKADIASYLAATSPSNVSGISHTTNETQLGDVEAVQKTATEPLDSRNDPSAREMEAIGHQRVASGTLPGTHRILSGSSAGMEVMTVMQHVANSGSSSSTPATQASLRVTQYVPISNPASAFKETQMPHSGDGSGVFTETTGSTSRTPPLKEKSVSNPKTAVSEFPLPANSTTSSRLDADTSQSSQRNVSASIAADTVDEMQVETPSTEANILQPGSSSSALATTRVIDAASSDKSGLKRVREVLQDFVSQDKGAKRPRASLAPAGGDFGGQSVRLSPFVAAQEVPDAPGALVTAGTAMNETTTLFKHVPCGFSRFCIGNIILADFDVGMSHRGGVLELSFEFSEEQLTRLDDWRQWFKHDKDVSESLCLSLACYPSTFLLRWEMRQERDDAEIVTKLFPYTSSWPKNNMLYMEVAGEQMSLSPPQLMLTEQGFVDISALVKSKRFAVNLRHYDDLSHFIFVLLIHPPTPSQLARVNNVRRSKLRWKEAIYKFSRPLTVMPLDVPLMTST